MKDYSRLRGFCWLFILGGWAFTRAALEFVLSTRLTARDPTKLKGSAVDFSCILARPSRSSTKKKSAELYLHDWWIFLILESWRDLHKIIQDFGWLGMTNLFPANYLAQSALIFGLPANIAFNHRLFLRSNGPHNLEVIVFSSSAS